MNFYTDHSPFWRYFKDKLAFGLIAAPGALAVLIHGLARYMDTVREDIYWVRDQFIPTQAEDQHIPLHGESRGVPRTRFDTDDRYRTRVEKAYHWHRLGGKEAGLPVILEEYGFESAKIHNLRQDDSALWAHFDVDLVKPPQDFSDSDIEAVLTLANQYKPGRSVIGRVQFASQQFIPICIGAVPLTTIVLTHRAGTRESDPPGPTPLYLGAASQSLVVLDHFVAAGDYELPGPIPLSLGAANHSYITLEHRII